MRLQKTLKSLAALGSEAFRKNAIRHSQLALKRAEAALKLDEDRAVLASLAAEVVATASS
jgi:hypothetical protein